MRSLKDLGALVENDSTQRYFAKRANIGLANTMAFGMGLQAPHIWHDARQRYLETQRQLEQAAVTPLGERLAATKEAERKIVSGREMKSPGTRSPSGSMPKNPQGGSGQHGWNLSSRHDTHGMIEHLFDKPEEMFGPVNQFGPPPPEAEHTAPPKGVAKFVSMGPISGTHMIESMLSHAVTNGIGGLFNMAHSAWKQRNFGAAREAILTDLKANDPIIRNSSDTTIADAMTSMIRFAPVLSTDKNAVRSYLREAVMSGAGPNYSTIKSLADAENTVTGKGKRD